MIEANKVRGEVSLPLGDKIYVLKPEHGRAATLDAALPRGVLGTLLQITDEGVIKARHLATVVYHLTDNPPQRIEDLEREIFDAGVTFTAGFVVSVMTAITAGLHTPPGEADAPSSLATESTGVSD